MKQEISKYLNKKIATPCGIFCPICPRFKEHKCKGWHCTTRRCTIYKCCVEKKNLNFCFECQTFPCSRFKQFSKTWEKLDSNLINNLERIKIIGPEKWNLEEKQKIK